jgi:ribonuclease D
MSACSPEWELIEDAQALRELVAGHAGCKAVVVDTEFMRRDTFYPQAALFQLCFVGTEKAWLLDPLMISDFSPLQQVFADASVVKIVHSPSEDLEVFQYFLGTLPEPLFDTQRAAAYLNLGFGLGYRALVQEMSGIEIPKGETQSNWLARPLRAAQLEYAAQDVVPLAPIYEEMSRRLEQGGRLEWLLQDGSEACRVAREEGAPGYQRIKSAWKLPSQQLALLALLCDWRESRARTLDKPRSWILKDTVCLQIAREQPGSLDELRAIPDLSHTTVRKQGEQLLQLLENRQGLQATPLPPPLSAGQRDTLKKLKQSARELARQWEVAPEVLLPAKDYEMLVRLGSGDEVEAPARWQGWRKQRLIEPLLEVALAGGH